MSSSILVSVRLISQFWVLLSLFGVHIGVLPPVVAQAAQQESSDSKKADAFFAGIVMVYNPEQITISRAVLGKTEKRSFRLTSETRVEGKLRMRVRVTVRYFTDDEEGDTATLIVVRAPQTKKK